MCGCLSHNPLLGGFQACALIGNQTSDPLVCRPVLITLSHISQGQLNDFLINLHNPFLDISLIQKSFRIPICSKPAFPPKHLDWFHFLAIRNSAPVNICTEVFAETYVSFSVGQTPRNGIAGSHGKFMFTF